jgi:hypothetical protein
MVSKLAERVDAVEMLVENAENSEAKEELRPKLVTLREQIKDLTYDYETRVQEVQERNKQAMQELKFLANRMNRRDERLSQEVSDPKENPETKADMQTGDGKKSKRSKKAAPKADGEGSGRGAKATARIEPKKKKSQSKDSKRGKENARSVLKQAKPVQLRNLDYAPEVAPRALGHTGWLAQAVPHVVPEKPDPAMLSSALAPWIGTAMWNAHQVAAAFPTAPLASSPVHVACSPSPFVPGPTPSPLYDGRMSIAGGLLQKPTVSQTKVKL